MGSDRAGEERAIQDGIGIASFGATWGGKIRTGRLEEHAYGHANASPSWRIHVYGHAIASCYEREILRADFAWVMTREVGRDGLWVMEV